MIGKGGFSVSQDFTIVVPKSGPAFPIPCSEWDRIKTRLRNTSTPPWLFENIAPGLAGIGLTMFISILVGMLPSSAERPNALIIAWAVVAVATISSALSFYFAHERRKMKTTYVSDVLADMDAIEARFAVEDQRLIPPASDLVILNASYGAGEHRVDVTTELVWRTENGKLHVYVGNQLGGDPCPNTPKDLIVRYRYKGEEYEHVVAEGVTLDLP